MENFFDELSDTFSTTNSDSLKRAAAQIGGQYESAGALKGQRISVVYGGTNILYDIVVFSRGGTIYTRTRAEFKSHAQYHLIMNTKVRLNFYLNIYGWKAAAKIRKYNKIAFSDELAGKFNIHGTDEAVTSSLLDEKAVKTLGHFKTHTFQIHCDGETGEIYSMIFGCINDPEDFQRIHHMVCSLIDRMKEQKMIDTN